MINLPGCTTAQFRQGAIIALEDINLQNAIEGATQNFRLHRESALLELPDSAEMRDHFKQLRTATLAQIAHHLEVFERNAQAAGATVHWAADGDDACAIIQKIAADNAVKLITKSKSMATEEIGLNHALEADGLRVVETDLGEYIIQLAGEPPSHIVGPAIHKTKAQVVALFRQVLDEPIADDIAIDALVGLARKVLRKEFVSAEMGISGGNILVAESGSVVLVTNEGNGRLVTSAPRIHVAVVGIEKVCPTWQDAAVWLSLLARSATGQPLSVYTSIISGPARAADLDGPEQVHIVLLDNGRSQLIGTEYEEILECIRCGACLNVCPVYRETGGHAYRTPVSGPIGAVINPLLFGLEKYEGLPQASTLCSACRDVCPARIDIPRMLLALRRRAVAEHLLPWHERKLEEAAAAALGSEKKMKWVTAMLRLGQKPFAKQGGVVLPQKLNPAGERKLPALAKRPFRAMWASGELEGVE